MTKDPAILNYLRKIGSHGGKKRSKTLTAKRRRQIARRASRARWGRKRSGGR